MNEITEKYSLSTFLFSEPNLLSGMARVLDLAATFNSYNISFSSEEDDYWAAYSDWEMVGRDLRFSINNFEKQTNILEKINK